MVDNENPIVFTITHVAEDISVCTKDSRWREEDWSMVLENVPPCSLFICIEAITHVGNSKGYAVRFEVN